MTESIDDMPPITPSETALMWTSYEHAIRMLTAANTIRAGGLHLIRNQLKDGTWHGMPAHLEGRRLLLLADVCTALTVVEGIPAAYFRAQGDLPEATPVDASGIA